MLKFFRKRKELLLKKGKQSEYKVYTFSCSISHLLSFQGKCLIKRLIHLALNCNKDLFSGRKALVTMRDRF